MGSKPKGISGSRAATVLGLNPWSTPFEVWQLIMEERTPGFNASHGYEMPPEVDNASTRWGTAFEDAACELASAAYGAPITDREREFDGSHLRPGMLLGDGNDLEMAKTPDLTCHVDGLVLDAVHEGKTTTQYAYRAKWGEPGTDKIPRYYGIQTQHNMMLSERERCLVSCLVFPRIPQDWEDEGWYVDEAVNGWWLNHDDRGFGGIQPHEWARSLDQMGYFHTYEVHADPELHLMMLDKYTEWWHKYVIPGVPPEPMNIDDIKRRIPNPSGTLVVSDPKVIGWMKEYRGIKDELKKGGTLDLRLDQLQGLILAEAMKGVDAVDEDTTDKWIFRGPDGEKLASWSKSKAGTFTFRVK